MSRTLDFIEQELRHYLGRHCPDLRLAVVAGLPSQGYHVNCTDGILTIEGGDEAGVLYGGYAYLNELGFRWFSPDPWDEEVPEDISIGDLDFTGAPKLDWRGFFAVEKRDTPEFLLWMARNKMNLWAAASNHLDICRTLQMRLRGSPTSGTHRACADYLHQDTYFARHPEWYSLIDGQRVSNMEKGDANNICFSNEEACRQLARNFADDLEHGSLSRVSAVVFAPFDNGAWCQCEHCRALGNKVSQFFNAVYYLQKELKARHLRPVTIIVPAYHETLPAPDRALPDDFDYDGVLIEFFPIERCFAHYFDDPRCLANHTLDAFLKEWTKLGKFRILIGEYYNVSTMASLAVPLDAVMQHDIPYYAENGVCAMDYMHVSTALWGELALNNCCFASMMWDGSFDTADFMAKRYHALASQATVFYNVLRLAMANCKCLKHYMGYELRENGQLRNFCLRRGLQDQNFPLLLPGHFELDKDHPGAPSIRTTLALLDQASAILAKMEEDVRDAIVKKRLAIDRERFDYTYNICHFLYHFLMYRLAQKEDNTKEMEKNAGHLKDFGEWLRSNNRMQAHIRAAGAPNVLLYENCLTVTQLQKEWYGIMEAHHLQVAPLTNPERGIVVQG